jgi:peptidoglycan/xylan/chitin deacetylase (PgdA/CDA1 family)
MPGTNNERVPRNQAHIPNVRNWSLRDYGNRVGVWRLMETMSRHGMRGTAATNSEVCNQHPEVIAEMVRLGWEIMGHNETNALRLSEMKPEDERASILRALDTIEKLSGQRPKGWLGAGLGETWSTLEYLSEGGVRYICDWVNDDQPYTMQLGKPPMVSLPYTLQVNDVPAYYDFKQSVPEFEAMMCRQFDTLYREGAESGRVMAIAVHPFVTGQAHRIQALDNALKYICGHEGVWKATGWEIVQHYLASDFAKAMS